MWKYFRIEPVENFSSLNRVTYTEVIDILIAKIKFII